MKANLYFWLYLAQFFLEWEIFQARSVEKIKTHILCSITFFPENRAVYEIMWRTFVSRTSHRWQWRMRVACWTNKATNRHTEYVILIAFPLQQWLHDGASLLVIPTLPVLFALTSIRISALLLISLLDATGIYIWVSHLLLHS